jgi:hypothetical protein
MVEIEVKILIPSAHLEVNEIYGLDGYYCHSCSCSLYVRLLRWIIYEEIKKE